MHSISSWLALFVTAQIVSTMKVCATDVAVNYTMDMTANGTKADQANWNLRLKIFRVKGIIDVYIVGVISVIGIFGNIVCAVVISKDKELKSTMRMLLLMLVSADCIFLVVAFITQTLGGALRRVIPSIDDSASLRYALLFTSQVFVVFIMVIVTVVRFITVCHPLKAKSMITKTRMLLVVAAAILVALVTSYPPIVSGIGAIVGQQMHFRSGEHKHLDLFYFTFSHGIIQWLLPFITFIALNIKLLKCLKSTADHRNSISSLRSTRQEDNVTKFIISMTVVFVISQTPAMGIKILNTIILFLPDGKEILGVTTTYNSILAAYYLLVSTVNILWVVNSSANFFLYFWFGKRFRAVLANIYTVRKGERSGRIRIDSASDSISVFKDDSLLCIPLFKAKESTASTSMNTTSST